MDSVNLFELASQQAKWATVRQRVVANNIANANTNGFTPSDVAPFKEVLSKTAGGLDVTHTNHIGSGNGRGEFNVTEKDVSPLAASNQRAMISAAGEHRTTRQAKRLSGAHDTMGPGVAGPPMESQSIGQPKTEWGESSRAARCRAGQVSPFRFTRLPRKPIIDDARTLRRRRGTVEPKPAGQAGQIKTNMSGAGALARACRP